MPQLPLFVRLKQAFDRAAPLGLRALLSSQLEKDGALVLAAHDGSLHEVSFWLRHGADPNALCSSALVHAIRMGRGEVVEFLLDHGANPHSHRDAAFVEAEVSRQDHLVPILRRPRSGIEQV